ncbi:uncharacterized protein Z518_10857 [Rhinocladiella mackenziei CBS 650.93]|uniref:Rhinocladiella mackenziei CBS 650.93 unplaced genomic scaffold supercont1.10, whole genome shotgun sequence n=1 Tax=Rhinocladiella mackenziei CBS 650.93 TaxID=1442369 RepID=A0A0D2IT78_9EURO|nr:uncharacterized protein Z518_10857 [Rhinocladiella mackenziei CBS 650.93]KIW99929.1 hypothetical protein Z518_10857 [Rhinocladiella mackenziei CBS 650.93]
MSTLVHTPATSLRPVTKPRRRQNHCCDPCRRSKRACDATGRVREEVCSNCARTGKECTFEKVRRTVAKNSTKLSAKSLPWRSPAREHVAVDDRSSPGQNSVFTTNVFHVSDQSSHGRTLSSGSADFPETTSSHVTRVLRGESQGLFPGSELIESWPDATTFEGGLGHTDKTMSLNPVPEVHDVDPAQLSYYDHDLEDAPSTVFSMGHSMYSDGRPARKDTIEGEDNESALRRKSSTLPDPSSDTLVHLLAEKTNKFLISESLTRIYQDTMENALSCWLTERTCPYTYEGIIEPQSPLKESVESPRPISWANCIVSRICQLDRPSCILRDRPLTPRENQAASRALKAAIMAFSSQWSHTANTSTESTANARSGDILSDLIDGRSTVPEEKTPTNFDRSIQEMLWNDVHRLLQETAGLDSFRVLFAQLIFSFTQKPLQRDYHAKIRRLRARRGNSLQTSPSGGGIEMNYTPDSENYGSWGPPPHAFGRYPEDPGDIEELKDLLELQGRPIHLESALLQLSEKRVKLERRDASLGPQAVDPISITDRKSFNLLFWMVMMCDTLVAALYRRPFIVSDEDSLILRVENPNQPPFNPPSTVYGSGSASDGPSSSLPHLDTDDLDSTPWGMLFLRRGETTKSTNDSPWPFSEEYASALLSDAAPVKVLLYRKARRLRNLLFRRAPARKIETGIVDALTVYEHWNKSYGEFMITCIQHHEELPPRIQSWYSVLLGHWHLAVFLLSDCIEEIDKLQKGDNLYGALRQSCRLVFEMRKTSALQVADICRVGRPRQDSSFQHTGNFHFTVSQGALLTEPWTEILIRCFARATNQFLRWLSDFQSTNSSSIKWCGADDFDTLYYNCANCIRALFDLGRKSDMAYLTALSFSERLQEIRNPSQGDSATFT